jgi:hypothetical protein
MSWPVIVYIAAPVLSLFLLVASAWRVWRRFRALLRDVRTTSERAAAAGNDVGALLDRLPNEPLAPMGAGRAEPA